MEKIEIIIPAYNEEFRISETLRQYADFFPEEVHMTVVLNGCTDNTLRVVQEIQRKIPGRISLMNIEAAIGKGGAVIAGWKKATAGIIAFIDADNATPPDEFEKLIKALASHDGAIASRFLPQSKIIGRQSLLRTSMSKAYIIFVKILFQLPFFDTQCGAKIFHKPVIDEILPDLRHADMTFDVELLWKLLKKKKDILEIPITWTDKPGSAALGSTNSFLKAGMGMLASLLRLRFAKK